MTQDLTYTAGEAADIASVNTNTQLAWRSRGFITSGGGKWARFALRDLARLRLMKAFSELGVRMKDAAIYAEAFAPNLAEAVFEAVRGIGNDMRKSLAIVERARGDVRLFTDWDLLVQHRDKGSFDSILIVSLAPLAAEMAKVIERIDTDRRIAALDAEIPASDA